MSASRRPARTAARRTAIFPEPLPSRPHLLFWVQHLLGIGHLKRAATLARTLADGFEVTLASGGLPVPGLVTGGAALVQLPPARATDVYFKHLVDAQDAPVDDSWRARRRDALMALTAEVRPDVIVTELFPFGRRQFRFELLPLIEALQAMRPAPRLVCSVRDILVAPPKPERQVEMLDLAERHYDQVLVHGDPTLVPFDETFPHMARLADRIRYTGYVVERDLPAAAGQEDAVVVSAGGGAVGDALLRAALAARPLTRLADAPWRVLAGHGMGAAAFGRLRAAAPPGVVVERARGDFAALLAACRVSVSQGGYNTVMDVLNAGTRAVVVPYAGGLETEQTLRAERLAARGALQVVAEADLAPATLAAAIERALDGPTPSAAGIDTRGAETARRLLLDLARPLA